jgi:hypothetical protein
MFNIFKRQSLDKLQSDNLYQAQRDLQGLEHKVYRYEVVLEQAKAELKHTQNRVKALQVSKVTNVATLKD